MILLSTTLESLATLVRDAEVWVFVWSLVVLWLCLWLCHLVSTRKTPRPWVVRKGECPCCGRALFGTTQPYQRLSMLDTLSAESPYLCPTCDRAKVADLLGKYHMELADD